MSTLTFTCTLCHHTTDAADTIRCVQCAGTVDAWMTPAQPETLKSLFDARLASKAPLDRSGVWRFRELILPDGVFVSRFEGNTPLYHSDSVARWCGLDAIQLKHEGENPTGSFKDRGMTAGITMAKRLGRTRVACASTGNTSASMAAYAAMGGMQATVFVPDGQIAYGKLSQALAYGAQVIQIAGDFDKAMTLVEQACAATDAYLLNSVNPLRIEGQKAIGFEILQDLDWQVPDWIVLPGGNLGNSSALGKGMQQLLDLGLIPRLPRIAVIQAAGAAPLYNAAQAGHRRLEPVKADTLATAIKIGAPVSWDKCWRGLDACDGVVTSVTDAQILDAKAQVDASGIGAEPASCATVAGIKALVEAGVIPSDAHVVGILTGHLLKDPDTTVGYHLNQLNGHQGQYTNPPRKVEATLDAVLNAMATP